MEGCVDSPTDWLLPEVASLERLAVYDWQACQPNLLRDRDAMMAQAAALYGDRRRGIEAGHLAGNKGATVVADLTAAADQLLQALYGFVASAHQRTACPAFALIAVGGYGRGELNPYSDLDLLFVSDKRLTEKMRAIASDLLLVLWDMKLDVGHSVRTFRDCIRQAVADETVRTALIECRFLAGDPGIYDDFVKEVTRKVVDHQPRRYIEAKLAQHFTRLQQQGGSIFVREPNVKEGVGGLRDIHFATWVGKTRYRAQSFEELMKIGSISRQEREFLASARSFLWRVRNQLHFCAGRKSDVLSFDQQVGLAEHLGYEDREGFPASVSFMRYFYCHAQQIHFLSDVLLRRFAHDFGIGARLRTRIGMRAIGDGFVLHKDWIGVPLAAQGRFRERPARLLELFELSATNRVPISHDTLAKISLELPDIQDAEICSTGNLAALRRLFTSEGPVGYWLRPMYQTGLFRRLVPEFARIQALCQ
ncbi:MAG: nucleotidyltransferase domain-containing protein, partial [Nitrospirota bacterium]